ncbi:phosphatidate cytidylyltransferase [Croceivirga thetidis]|uniref:Phosphatidate cytidylyltransferase n=1 Tax=Croceivirga thetidis TaxID=2721623 RepID=A0ABX1GWN6_9FLAO|nr:phosphatidate cytidylyltransferase [Croceivirga thetidis]NKI33370.1 phosphatidate cytidylyltransferase [Croceivirga thetidis]
MRELLRRSLTGIIYVILLLSAVFLSTDAYDFLFMAFGLGCLYEFKRIVKLKGYYIFMVYLLLWWLFIYFLEDTTMLVTILMVLTLTINLALLAYLFSPKQKTFNSVQKFIIALFYIGGGCIFLTKIPYSNDVFAKYLITGIFILIWVNDTFAYVVGRLIGKNKLYPSVSPKKTIEGFLGGFVFALVASYLISKYVAVLDTMQWLILASVVVFMGTLGDLLESKFKRVAKVKDSGAILPGHGGILDRLDSLVFAAPFAYFTLKIFANVS